MSLMTTFLPYNIARELVAIHDRELRDAAARSRLVRRLRHPRREITPAPTLQLAVALPATPVAASAPTDRDTPAAA